MKQLLLPVLFSIAIVGSSFAQFLRVLDLPPHDLVYSAFTGRLYATLEQTTQFDTLELVTVDPLNATIGDTLRFPGRPVSLAVSANGQYLYVGSIFPNRVRRINLNTSAVELNFALQNDAAPVKIIPSLDSYKKTVIVEGLPAPVFGSRVALYDDSIARPASIQNSETVVFRNPNTLLGIYNGGGNSVIAYNVTANGIEQATISSVNPFPPNTTLKMVAGRLVMSNGYMYTFNGQYLQYYSFYFNEPFQYGGPFAADPDSGVVYYAFNWVNPVYRLTLHSFTTNGARLSTLGLNGLMGSADHLTAWGGHGRLAFKYGSYDGLRLVILNPCQSAIPPPVITPSSPGGCDSDTITLSGPPGAAGYYWSDGSNDLTTVAMYQQYYTLRITGPDGCLSPPSDTIQILTDSRPPVCALLSDGFQRICAGDSAVFTVAPPPGWESVIAYLSWSTGDTTSDLTVSTAGQYTVQAVTIHGCAGDPRSVFVEVEPLPAQPQIQAGNNVLYGSSGFGYRWYLNGTLLPAQTGSLLIMPDTGTYTLEVLSSEGCVSPLSEPFYWSGPVNTQEAPFGLSGALRASAFRVIDLRGSVVAQGKKVEAETLCAALPDGYYFFQWLDDRQRSLGGSAWVKIGRQ